MSEEITVIVEQTVNQIVEVDVEESPATIELNQGNTGPQGPTGPTGPVGPSTIVPFGSWSVPLEITAAGGISVSSDLAQLRFVQGSGGPVDVTANPQIAPPTAIGQSLILVGCSDVNTIKLEDGNGLKMNGFKTLKQGTTLRFLAVALDLWLEDTRSWV